MISFKHTEVNGFPAAIRGMRNAKNSWSKADSKSGICSYEELDTMVALRAADYTDALYEVNPELTDGELDVFYENYKSTLYENAIMDEDEHYCSYFILGENDKKLAVALAKAGPDHGKFLRQIQVSVDITAPLFWFKEFDTYKVGTVANSTSTMHTIANSPITVQNFSFDFLMPQDRLQDAMCDMITIVNICENLRKKYLEEKAKESPLAEQYWRMLIEFLPNGWLQTRTVTLNYAVLRNMYRARKNHKLKEWHMFCNWIAELPYANELIIND